MFKLSTMFFPKVKLTSFAKGQTFKKKNMHSLIRIIQQTFKSISRSYKKKQIAKTAPFAAQPGVSNINDLQLQVSIVTSTKLQPVKRRGGIVEL